VVQSVRIVLDKDGKSRGFGFVEMATPEGTESVRKFADAMNNTVTMMGWKNVNLRVHEEKRHHHQNNNSYNSNNNSASNHYSMPNTSSTSNNMYASQGAGGGGVGGGYPLGIPPLPNQQSYGQQQAVPPPYMSQQGSNGAGAAGMAPPPYTATSSSLSGGVGQNQPPAYTSSRVPPPYTAIDSSTSGGGGGPPPYSVSGSNDGGDATGYSASSSGGSGGYNASAVASLQQPPPYSAPATTLSSSQQPPPYSSSSSSSAALYGSMPGGTGVNNNAPAPMPNPQSSSTNIYNAMVPNYAAPPPGNGNSGNSAGSTMIPPPPNNNNAGGGGLVPPPPPTNTPNSNYFMSQQPPPYNSMSQQQQNPSMIQSQYGSQQNYGAGPRNASMNSQQSVNSHYGPSSTTMNHLQPPHQQSSMGQQQTIMPAEETTEDVANKVFIKNLPLGTEVGELVEYIESLLPGNGLGRVKKANIQADKNPRVHWCFAHVEFDYPSDAAHILTLQGLQLKGRAMKCVLYRPKTGNFFRGGGGGGGRFSQYGPSGGTGGGAYRGRYGGGRDHRRDRPY